MKDLAIGLDLNVALSAVADSNTTFLSCEDVEVGRIQPLRGMFCKPGDQDWLFGSLCRVV